MISRAHNTSRMEREKGIWAKLTLSCWHQTMSFEKHATPQAAWMIGVFSNTTYLAEWQRKRLTNNYFATKHINWSF
jgi:hypothetical protein